MFIGPEWQEAGRDPGARHRVLAPLWVGQPCGLSLGGLGWPCLPGGHQAGGLGGPAGCRGSPHRPPSRGGSPQSRRKAARSLSGAAPLPGQPWRKDGVEFGRGVSSGSQQSSLCVWTPLTHLLAPFTFLSFSFLFFSFCLLLHLSQES